LPRLSDHNESKSYNAHRNCDHRQGGRTPVIQPLKGHSKIDGTNVWNTGPSRVTQPFGIFMSDPHASEDDLGDCPLRLGRPSRVAGSSFHIFFVRPGADTFERAGK
jgi:hypothetical protein